MDLKKVFRIGVFVSIGFLLISWGYTGHYHISQKAALSFNEEMEQFNAWTSFLASHASDADARKDEDPNEGPKHYIDIDNYNEFGTTGRIPQTYDSVIDIYGYNFVKSQGFLPWATEVTFDSIVQCFIRRDWEKAQYFAADLGHYVADGHMPMHITANYNGQLTDNYGIHSRYESTMINAKIGEFSYEGMPIDSVEDVNQYIFDYLYENYVYVDSVIAADDYATAINSDYYSSAYKDALWEKTGDFTIELFKNASHAIAELLYTAWLRAGRPDLNSTDISEMNELQEFVLVNTYPNPFINQTNIDFKLETSTRVNLTLLNSIGQVVDVLVNDYLPNGSYSYKWSADNCESGIYYMVFSTSKQKKINKLILMQ